MYEFERSQGKMVNVAPLKISVWLGLREGKGHLKCPSIRPNFVNSLNGGDRFHKPQKLLEFLPLCGISHCSQAVAMSHNQPLVLRKEKEMDSVCVFLSFTVQLFHFNSRFSGYISSPYIMYLGYL